MISNVIAGIAIALNQEFGDDYEIYTEEIKQDFSKTNTAPCATVAANKVDRFPNQTVFDGQSILYTVFPGIRGQSE